MRRKNEIIAQLLNDEISLEEAMNRAMHIAIEMGDSEFQNWLNKEICGYDTKEKVPDYRMIHGIIIVYDKYGNTYELPQRINDEKFQIISHQGNALGIKGIRETIDNNNIFLAAGIPVENYPYLQQIIDLEINNAILKVNKTQFEDILSTVKTELIKRLTQKKLEIKNLNKYDMEEKMSKNVEKITIKDNSINIGNGNTISDSNFGNKNKIITKEKNKKNKILISVIIAVISGILVYVFLETNLWKNIQKLISNLGI